MGKMYLPRNIKLKIDKYNKWVDEKREILKMWKPPKKVSKVPFADNKFFHFVKD